MSTATLQRKNSSGKSEAVGSAHKGYAPDPETLRDVMKVLPKDALEQRVGFAFFTTFRVWAFTLLGLYLTSIAPWYLLPLTWVFFGTAATGLFVVAHDCAHQSFSKSRTLNEVVGTICMMPLMFPYCGWELTHNHHHQFANHLDKDHLWRPLKKEQLEKMSTFSKYVAYYMYGPLFFESSILHHAYHFLLPIVARRAKAKTGRSVVFALLGCAMTPYGISYLGPLWKLYWAPFLVFQFWLSTFTLFHHRNPRGAGWKEDKDWNKVYGSLFATVHVAFPSWIEYLTLDINWHLPHHASALIPWYNLRKCTHALMMAYGDRLCTDEFSWELWKEVTRECHMYDPVEGYKTMWA